MLRYFILTPLLILFCGQFLKAQDSVSVTFQVAVPSSTPENATVFWAGSLNNWEPGNGFIPKSPPLPLRKKRGSRQLTLTATKGDTVIYKYTLGSMFSIEEQDDFTYRPLRNVIFNEAKTVYDTVAAWHDRPPRGLRSQWPNVTLKPTKQTIKYYGSVRSETGTILYDKARSSGFTDMSRYNTDINSLPDKLSQQVFYFLKLSKADDNTVLVMAGKKAHQTPWNVYVDQNNDNSISYDENIFTIQSDTSQNSWSGQVHYQKLAGDESVDAAVNLTLQRAVNLPSGYRSSDVKGAPDLVYSLPLKQRKGTLNGHHFYLITPFTERFSQFFYVVVDQDHNDSLRIGSGSNEMATIQLNQMIQQRKYYILPKFKLGDDYWEVVHLNSQGTSIRLRPAKNFKAKADISPGKPAPEWHGTTVDGEKISSESLRGKYLFLNFWGSWCGGCVQEIPKLKQAYKEFRGENFQIIGFDYGDNREMFHKAQKKYDLSWPQVFDQYGKYKKEFSVSGFPTNYLIGPNGNVLAIGTDLRGQKLTTTLKKYVK